VRVARVAAFALLLLLVVTPAASALDIEQDDAQPTEGEVGTPYSFQFVAEEGCPPSYRFRLSSGNLPPGLIITREGKLTGIPTQAGFFDFYVEVADDCSFVSSQGYFKMKVLPDLAVATTTLPRPQPGLPYSTKLVPLNLEAGWSVTWVLRAGSLPPGLTLSSDGTISGTPTGAGKWGFTVRVQEQFRRYGDRDLTLVVAAPLSLPATTSQGEVGLGYRSGLSPVGGLGPMSFAVTSGALPPGLSLDAVTGQLQGVPGSAGNFTATVSVTDSGGETATAQLTIAVAARLVVTTKLLPTGSVGDAYRTRLARIGGLGPFRWRIAAGALPKGLKLDRATGRLSGVPLAAGTFRLTVEARDRLGAKAKRALVLRIIV
jgi:hypothetical protein